METIKINAISIEMIFGRRYAMRINSVQYITFITSEVGINDIVKVYWKFNSAVKKKSQ